MSALRGAVRQAGMFYVARRLSLKGWFVRPKVVKGPGPDIRAKHRESGKIIKIQVRSLSDPNAAQLGENLDKITADFLIVCLAAHTSSPECFVIPMRIAKKWAENKGYGHWLLASVYQQDRFRKKWNRLCE